MSNRHYNASGCRNCGSKWCGPSFVYIIDGRSDGAIKVGYATKPSARCAKLRKALKQPSLFVCRSFDVGCTRRSMLIEEVAHAAIWQWWTGRGEWFLCTIDEAERAIRAAMAAAPSAEAD